MNKILLTLITSPSLLLLFSFIPEVPEQDKYVPMFTFSKIDALMSFRQPTQRAMSSALVQKTDSFNLDTEKEDKIALEVIAPPDQLVDARINYSASGNKAFYLDPKYTDSIGGICPESTQAYVADNDEVLVAQDSGGVNETWAEKLGYPSGKRVVILHADDVGMCEEATVSAKRYLENDYIQSAAAMPPCPNFEESIQWAKANPQEDVGLHLTLTSEWQTYRWGPVADPADVPGLVDPEGKLWHKV